MLGEPDYERDDETIVDLGGGMRVPLSELIDDQPEQCPLCPHTSDDHSETGCTFPGCWCPGP